MSETAMPATAADPGTPGIDIYVHGPAASLQALAERLPARWEPAGPVLHFTAALERVGAAAQLSAQHPGLLFVEVVTGAEQTWVRTYHRGLARWASPSYSRTDVWAGVHFTGTGTLALSAHDCRDRDALRAAGGSTSGAAGDAAWLGRLLTETYARTGYIYTVRLFAVTADGAPVNATRAWGELATEPALARDVLAGDGIGSSEVWLSDPAWARACARALTAATTPPPGRYCSLPDPDQLSAAAAAGLEVPALLEAAFCYATGVAPTAPDRAALADLVARVPAGDPEPVMRLLVRALTALEGEERPATIVAGVAAALT